MSSPVSTPTGSEVSAEKPTEAASTPRISVVVSTHNRAASLPRLVASLEAQDGVHPFEAVIVDDCSTDETWEVLQDLARRTAIPMRFLRTPVNSGPAGGRNLGWRAARPPFVAFTDRDLRPQPAWA